MESPQSLAQTFRRILKLKAGPVAVRIIKNDEEVPVLLKKPEAPIPSFCHAVTDAFKGKGYFLEKGDIQCPTGLKALGLKKEGSSNTLKKHPLKMGIFGNEEAARNYLSKGSALTGGQTKAVLICPLEKAVMGFDVVLFKANSEQTMWLLAATQYLAGGRNDLCLGTGYQGVCGDVIAYPLMTQKVNITVNGLSVGPVKMNQKNEIFVGIPGLLLEKIAANLIELFNKPFLKAQQSPRCVRKYGNFGNSTSSSKRPRIISG
ncbi:MAG TPA: DUF169 domain-containing protein [Thermodesulfobacteriota bacterium]|nr:DUF169 domain-containing protein [Thermodesulfobacteriota bacterium]